MQEEDAFPGEVALLLCHLPALAAEISLAWSDRPDPPPPAARFLTVFESFARRLEAAGAEVTPADPPLLRTLWQAGLAALAPGAIPAE